MKKIKIIFALIILAVIGLFVYQNQDYFMIKTSLKADFYFRHYILPEAVNGIYWLGCFALGFLISYFSSLLFRFKAQKKIKLQNQTIENYRETVQELKNEVEKIKASGYLDNENIENLKEKSEEAAEETIITPEANPATGA